MGEVVCSVVVGDGEREVLGSARAELGMLTKLG